MNGVAYCGPICYTTDIEREDMIMGYYTDFEVSVVDGDDNDVIALEEALGKYTAYSFSSYPNDGNVYLNDAKWYDHEKDMLVVSKLPQFAGKLLLVHGDGEESGDVWDMWVKDGKKFRGTYVMIAPEFSEDKLA